MVLVCVGGLSVSFLTRVGVLGWNGDVVEYEGVALLSKKEMGNFMYFFCPPL